MLITPERKVPPRTDTSQNDHKSKGYPSKTSEAEFTMQKADKGNLRGRLWNRLSKIRLSSSNPYTTKALLSYRLPISCLSSDDEGVLSLPDLWIDNAECEIFACLVRHTWKLNTSHVTFRRSSTMRWYDKWKYSLLLASIRKTRFWW